VTVTAPGGHVVREFTLESLHNNPRALQNAFLAMFAD